MPITAASRSTSISSSSTASSSSKYSADLKKKFSCNFPACGKSFSRSEHLHRHALNHKEGTNTCQRCSAHFRRRDLLDRHIARHKEKDDEAGGEGLGVLATRKRLWRDATGAIVNARRPAYTPEGPVAKRRAITDVKKRDPRPAATMTTKNQGVIEPQQPLPMSRDVSRDPSRSSSTIIEDQAPQAFEYPDPDEDRKTAHSTWLEIDNTLPSPPLSSSSLPSSAHSPHSITELDALYEDASWPSHSPLTSQHGLPSPVHPEFQSHEAHFPAFNQAPFQTFMGAMDQLPYDDIFKPEAGVWDWQQFNSQVLMSSCREERYGPKYETAEGREWVQSQERRGFGVGV
ncbi:hypothetical protein BJ878DRAFT_238362 [Calycina marina]|uniref:C2H2-type domain-containing protein n=1 Tax=Calycina marina TaxID=1763456 RepID=A0A9P7Z7R3_9HELO|nr:hypothetical protein BJ878DRAFT_238362 [Calycina marina]